MSDSCYVCGKSDQKLFRCGACKSISYCSRTCQKKDWKSNHKDICNTFKTRFDNLKFAVESGEKISENCTWRPFLSRATVENVMQLDEANPGYWELRIDEKNKNMLVVMDTCCPFKGDNYDEAIVGKGPFPESTDELVKILFACMMFPYEDNIPRRPEYIKLTPPLVNKWNHKHLWSEMLRVRTAVWRIGNKDDDDMQDSLRCFPNKRVGTYAKGETFYEPQLKLRIQWLSDEERRDRFNELNPNLDIAECIRDLEFNYNVTDKKARWQWEGYNSVEEYLKDYDCEHDKTFATEEIYEYQHDVPDMTIEALCMDMYYAKSLEECVWDSWGVPRLTTEDENANITLKAAGFECQGYKPGKFFELNERSVQLGQRLIEYKGFFWEEKKRTKETRDELFRDYMASLQQEAASMNLE